MTLPAGGSLNWTGSTIVTSGVSSPGNLLRLSGPSFPGFLLAGTTDTTGITFQFVGTQTSGAGATLAYGQLSGGALGAGAGSMGMKEAFVDYVGNLANKITAFGLDSNANINFFGAGGPTATKSASMNIKAVTANTTLSLASATTNLINIPAGALVLGVTARVTTTITAALSTSWSLGTGAIANDFGSGLAFAAGTTVNGTNYVGFTGSQMYPSATALNAVLNTDAATAGAIRVVVYYVDTTAPTS